MSFDLSKLMQEFGQVPEVMNKVQEKLGAMRVTGSAGADMVTIQFNGRGEALSMEISDDAFKADRKFLQELIIAAINDGANKREKAKLESLKSISGLEGVLGGQ